MVKKKTSPTKAKPAKIPQPSKSYMTFEQVVKRSLDLITLQQPVEKIMALDPKQKSIDLSDMTRAAVVLAVAAMDAYFTDVFAERLVPFLKKRGATKAIVTLLEKAGVDTECALQLLAMQRPFRRIRTLIEGHLEQTTTQKIAVIDKLFLAYGLKTFSTNIQKLKKRKKLLASVDALVKRRHKIAHEGDMNSHGKVNAIKPAEIKRRITDVVDFVSGADEILQKQLTV